MSGALARSSALFGAVNGGSFSTARTGLVYQFAAQVGGAGEVAGAGQWSTSLLGYVKGYGAVIDGREIVEAGVVIAGSGSVGARYARVSDIRGYASGSSAVTSSEPAPIRGIAVVAGFMEVICVPYPICQTPAVPSCFRWGHQFGPGDLQICLAGAQCVSYTLYQIQKGCVPRQVGPSDRRPGKDGSGCYYATGTAGECGQPGLWLIRWTYQQSFGACLKEKDCYFYVLDSVLCPVGGDELPRVCKYGWD